MPNKYPAYYCEICNKGIEHRKKSYICQNCKNLNDKAIKLWSSKNGVRGFAQTLSKMWGF